MTRTLWIVALASALVCFAVGTGFYATAWFSRRDMSVTSWFVLVSSVLLLWVAARYLRFCIGEAAHASRTPGSGSPSPDGEPLHG